MAEHQQAGAVVVDNHWQTSQYRQKVVGQIDEAMRQSGNTITKSSLEMEQHVFNKARTREEYLALVARLIIHVREIKKKPEGGTFGGPGGVMAAGPGGPMMVQGPGGLGTVHPAGPAPGSAAQPGTMASPIDALRDMTKTGPNIPQPGMPVPGQMMGQVMGPAGIQRGPMMQQAQQPFQSYSRPMPPQVAMAQHMGQRMPGAPPMVGVRPDFMQQQIGGPMQQQMGVPMQQQMGGMQQQMGGPNVGASAGDFSQGISQPQSMSMISGPTPTVSLAVGNHFVGTPSAPMMSMALQGQPARPLMSSQANMPIGSQVVSQPINTGAAPVQSPATNLSLAHSPAPLLPSPSSGQNLVNQSPMSRAMTGVPSPNISISLGPTASPSSQLTANEEQAYLAKWKQLQIYIEPLKRMINKMDKDEDRKNMNKMKNLLDILSDSSKRVSMNAMLKCEQVLRQNFTLKDDTPKTAAVDVLPTSIAGDTHICQTLMDAVVSQLSSPLFNHTLHRTFGPAIQALHGPAISVPTPPMKRAKLEEDSSKEPSEISSVLQGEVARLNNRFQVSLDPLHHAGSKTIYLLCHLKDKLLPAVPPISVIIPEDYPSASPTCCPPVEEYELTPYLQKVHKLLTAHLLQLPDRFALTALLDTWEMSVRRACNPAA